MNLDELQAVRSKERRTDSLQHLRASFYDDVDEYVAGLRAKRDEAVAAADHPYESEEARRLQDELESATTTLESIWEARVAKINRYASLAAHDYPSDDEALTPRERELYRSMVEDIAATRAEVVAGVGEGDRPDALADAPREAAAVAGGGAEPAGAGPEAASGAGASTATPAPASPKPDAGAAADTGAAADAGATDAPPADAEAVAGRERPADAGTRRLAPDDRTTVRLTDDVGSILGIDEREYDLASEDVVTLPDENAHPLVNRDAAEEVQRDARE